MEELILCLRESPDQRVLFLVSTNENGISNWDIREVPNVLSLTDDGGSHVEIYRQPIIASVRPHAADSFAELAFSGADFPVARAGVWPRTYVLNVSATEPKDPRN